MDIRSDAHATWDKGVCKFKNLIVGNFGFNYLTGPLPSCFSSSSLNFQWNCFDTNSWRQRPPEQCSHVEGNHFIDKGPSNEEDSWTERNVLRVLIAGVLACLLLLLGIYFRYLHGAAPANPSKPAFSDLIQKIGITGVLKASKEELEIACEDFSNIIGSSSHGKLFKGTLANGTEIAVTMVQTSTWSKDSESDFIYEVNRLASIKHKNVVNLLGYCAEDHPLTRMLIFEYVSNGTLFDLLQNCDGQYLDWNARMRIIMGVAYGLEYLHHALLPPTGFCKFGSRSVYLTEDYAAKLAGFEVGKSHLRSKTKVEPVPNEGKRLSVIDRSDGVSNRDDPARSCQNFGADVYSFGVFLVEIISGRPVYSKEQEQGALIDWATGYICSPGLIAQMVDPNLTFLNLNHLEALRDIICRCIDAESRRPTMKAVTSMLETSLGITSEDAYPKHSPLLWAELIIQMQD
ncbi:hypothetical protein KP509_22G050300 [Ceratopteris richardii]|uniref:Protein kinase domain-containing protein n=1 Tax=Ceratopteris richardii TaxID=49495 RepID=A0A8T2S7T3_CERRI|nr:hypothetical protein KP509_22G050300 [Ceratopteris richardii]